VRSPNPADFVRTVNETVRRASGEIILFLDSDMLVIEPGWLKEMVLLAKQPGIGAIGAKIRAAGGKTWLGGMFLGLDQIAGPVHGNSAAAPGYFGKLMLTQDVSCVSAACMAVPRTLFESAGGFDESNLVLNFNDVDFCLRLRRGGYRVMWTPYARLHHRRSKKPVGRGNEERNEREREIVFMRERWGQNLERDPFWNPNLSLASNHPQVSLPPRITRPWQETTAREQ
jgi:GT2 family glycosyltransferase